MEMTEEMGELLHKVEMLEMDFLRENGVNPNYNDVENHIGKIIGMFEKQFEQNLEMNPAEIENALQDLDDKCNAISSASSNLAGLRKAVVGLKKSQTKELMLMFIQSMEMDLC